MQYAISGVVSAAVAVLVSFFVCRWLEWLRLHPRVEIAILPGGSLPVRKTEGAIGFDCRVRAIVCPFEMDPANPVLRKTIFDFEHRPENPEACRHVRKRADGSLAYDLLPGESVLVGIGHAVAMPFPVFYWVAPRSGHASKRRVTLGNAPGTIDPDYRGEAGVIVVNNGTEPFELSRDVNITQEIFQQAFIPRFQVVPYDKLSRTKRGAGGFGSTGR